MWPDGVCRVTDTYYTKTVQFQDINYQLSQNEDKAAIFEGWCDFLNYFDSSIRFQFSFLNLAATRESYEKRIVIPPQGDDFDSIRAEYTEMLQNQLARGNNGLVKTKYLTFGVDAESIQSAKPRLERIETDLLNHFKRLGVSAAPLNGAERLCLLHSIFHMDEPEPFRFSWDWLAPSGLSTKDFIAPTPLEFPGGKTFRMGRKFGAVSFLQILAPELNDRILADFLDMESSLVVSMHVQSVDQVSAIKTIKRKITDLDRTKIEEQKKAVRAGYDMDIIPSDLATYGEEAKKLLQDLQSRNERMFLVAFLLMNTAESRKQLDNNMFQAGSTAQKHNCRLVPLDLQPEEGLMSCLPLGLNQVEIQRGLTSSSTAIFVPFTTQELFQTSPEALYYGINALSNNLIMVDRKLLKNPNGLILGTPGSGKSFSSKREITNVFLVTEDDVLVCDPEDEYAPLVKRLGGQVVKISPTSTQYVNPMDINLNYSDDDNPLALKVDFLLSFCDIVVGSKDGLQPVEKTVIDRCVRNVYRPYLADPDPARMPILQDLYDELLAQPETEAQRIAAALENGDSLELVLGATELTVTQGGRITTLDMGAAPFVRDGHTYIPVRAAAEALGLDVYWDDTYEAAHLTDYAALTAELDSRFTAANGIWAAIRDTIPREAGKGYESTASMRLSATLYGEEEHDTASLTMEVKQLTRDGSYRMEQEQQVDLGGLGDTLFAGLSPEELAQLENHSVTLYDRESGTLYQKGVQLYSCLLYTSPSPRDTR